MNQLSIDFTTGSKLNRKHLTGQNKTVFNHLEQGNTITSLEAFTTYGVTALHSRISDLRNKVGVVIHDRFITLNGVKLKEYSLTPFGSI